MTDTTDQQAVTVAQEDRDAAAVLEAILRDVWDGYSSVHAIREGCADDSSIVQAFARYRHRLASVSSASAEAMVLVDDALAFTDKIAEQHRQRANAAEARIAAAIDCLIQPGEGWQAYSLRLRAMLAASPEPVPATNQAGDVELKDQAREVLAQAYDNAGRPESADRVRKAWPYASKPGELVALDAMIAFAALATQPATSQEGEKQVFDGLTRDEYNAMAAAEQTAATPTPPTLSENLREIPDEVFRKIADAKDVGTCRARVVDALLAFRAAQVKAS